MICVTLVFAVRNDHLIHEAIQRDCTNMPGSKNDIAICLLSGGLDSCVTAAFAKEAGHELAFLHVNYGQRTEARELKAFKAISRHYEVTNTLVVNVGYLKEIGGSALTDPNLSVPMDSISTEDVPITYVPFRNAHLIAIAVSWAEVLGAGYVYIGATEVDYSGYPDCRRSFFDAMEKAVDEGTRPETRIKIMTPIIQMGKKEVVEAGARLNVPFELTWSCYTQDETACARCESCLLRLKGFRQAGIRDPIPYTHEIHEMRHFSHCEKGVDEHEEDI